MAFPDLRKIKDEELVELILKTGNSQYFEIIYNRYFSKVYYQILSYVKDNEEARDVSQDVFVKLYDNLSKFRAKSTFSTWLYSFARNAVLDHLRRKGKLKEDPADEEKLESIPEPGDDELLRIKADRLAYILDQIHPDDKALLIMKYAHEWQMDEIAEKMDLSLSAVKMRISRAKQKVLSMYEKTYEKG